MGLKAKIDAALSALTGQDGGLQDGAMTDLSVDAYGALYMVQTNSSGVAIPSIPVEYTVLASAARTTLQSVTITNSAGYRGVIIVIDATASADTPSVTPTIEGVSTLGSDDYVMLTGAAITGASTTVLRVYPGAVAVANLAADNWLPASWKFKMAVADADSITYSVNAILLP